MCASLTACGPPDVKWQPPPLPDPTEPEMDLDDDDFEDYSDGLLDKLLALTPSWGRYVGLHDYDGKIADYSMAGINKRIATLKAAKTKLASFAVDELDDDAALDHAILSSKVDYELFELTEWRLHKVDPRFYEEMFDVSGYINFDYAPLDQRAKALLAHEEAALQQTKHILANLDDSVSKPGLETAINVIGGYVDYLRSDVAKVVSTAGDDAFKKRFADVNENLAKEAERVTAGLKDKLAKASPTSFVLGTQRYKRFVMAQEGMKSLDLAAFKAQAEKDLQANKSAFVALSKKIKPTRPKKQNLLAAATRIMDESRQFVIDKKLVTIPSEDRCTLKESPPYMSWNEAFLNMPGPFDTAKQAYYYITMPNPKWPKKKQENYIFTWGVLQATTVHEVYPGHFLHGLWQRRAPTRVQKMVDSYSFVEGWAHYTEQLMIEEGFGAKDPQNRLGQLRDALLRNCRFVASIGLHTEGMTLDQATQLFVDNCFQDAASARNQAVRGTFDPGYFAYTVGKLQILELREELKKKLGAKFNIQKFHDAMMSYGAPPVALIRDRVKATMLED